MDHKDFVKGLIKELKDKDLKINRLELELNKKNEVIRQLKDLVMWMENKVI